jgi:hypothetical protein
VDAVVADVAHESGELAERIRLPPAVAGQAVAQGVGDCALELRRAVAVDELVHCGCCRAQALARRVPRALDGGAELAGCCQEHAAAVGLDCLPEAAFCPGIKAERAEIGDEDVGLDAPQALLAEAVPQPDYVRQYSRAVHAYSYPGR